jgi:hypothetical protein
MTAEITSTFPRLSSRKRLRNPADVDVLFNFTGPWIGQSIHDPLSHEILKHCLSADATIPRRY